MSVDERKYKFCPTCKNPLEKKNIDGENVLSCTKCGFVFWDNPKPVVSVILAKDGKILMLQRAKEPLKNYWCLPGGFIRYEETPEEALIRETREETGLNIQIKDLVGVYRIDNDPRGVTIDSIYAGEFTGGIKLSTEDSTYKFFGLTELPDKIAYKHREAILDWSQSLKPSTSVTVLATDTSGKILLAKIKSGSMKGKWVLPGGFIETTEDPKEAARRELKEETGIQYQGSLELLDVVKDTLHPSGWGVEIFYRAKNVSKTNLINSTNETTECAFFDKNNLPDPINKIHRSITAKI